MTSSCNTHSTVLEGHPLVVASPLTHIGTSASIEECFAVKVNLALTRWHI